MFMLMPFHLLIHSIQCFSLLQQYFIILFLSFIILYIFNHYWYILLLPLSTIFANFAVRYLSDDKRSPLKFSRTLYYVLVQKRTFQQIENLLHHGNNLSNFYRTALHKECDTYIRTIIARYVGVWYYTLISTDQEFPDNLVIIFHVIVNRFSDRFKSLKPNDLIRLIIHLQQQHVAQYLHAHDSYRKQRRQNRISKSLVEEFGQINGFHPSLVNNDTHAYLKALVELLLTDLIPESFHIYSASVAGREFITQILVNCIFLPLFNQFSKPQTLYHLLVLLWETEGQKKIFEINENSLAQDITTITHQTEFEQSIQPLIEETKSNNNEPSSSGLERIIYSATITSYETAYDATFGGAYTVYFIQCETKSPFKSDAIHRCIIGRRFREFLNLHNRLKQNQTTNRYYPELDEIFQKLPIPFDNMNPDIIRRRRCTLEQYIQAIISNEVLNCSHDVLEFFAFNSDPNTPFETLPSKLPVPRVDKVLLRTLSDVGTRLNILRSTRREATPIPETFQLNVSTTYEDASPTMDQLKLFIQRSSFRYPSYPSRLNSIDSEFLKILLTRPSIAKSHRHTKFQSEVPLTDAVLDLIYTGLHSRDTFISYRSTNQILRILFGYFIEEFLKNQIDDVLSMEKIIVYLVDLRTKVLWPDDNSSSLSMENLRQRAFNACLNKIPDWLQHIVGKENIHRVIKNFLDCLSYEKLNRHFLCNLFDLLIEQLIPNIATKDFLTKYVQMHAGVRR